LSAGWTTPGPRGCRSRRPSPLRPPAPTGAPRPGPSCSSASSRPRSSSRRPSGPAKPVRSRPTHMSPCSFTGLLSDARSISPAGRRSPSANSASSCSTSALSPIGSRPWSRAKASRSTASSRYGPAMTI